MWATNAHAAESVSARNAGQSIWSCWSPVACGLLITIGMWWTYFDRFAEMAQERLVADGDPVLAAADAYSYLHLFVTARIIVFAVGMRAAVLSVGHPLIEGRDRRGPVRV